MTGWERHSLHSIPGVKVGKVRVQVLGTGGHTFMLTEECLPGEAVTYRGVRNTRFLSQKRKEICLGECVSITLPFYLTALKIVRD